MRKIEHIGIEVKSLDVSNALFEKLFGQPPYKEEEVASEGVKTSFFMNGPNKIELLEATNPESPIAKFLEKKGEGIHHIAFDVNDINEEIIRGVADKMVDTGLRDAGYIYLNLDDCWHGKRDSLGFITADPVKFPSGIKALADYIHSKGLKIGIYSDAGRTTCGGRPGSFGHVYQDALMYAKWGIDYLKYDWCATEDINPVGAYNLMRDALRAAGRPVLFSMCEWGHSKPWTWALAA